MHVHIYTYQCKKLLLTTCTVYVLFMTFLFSSTSSPLLHIYFFSLMTIHLQVPATCTETVYLFFCEGGEVIIGCPVVDLRSEVVHYRPEHSKGAKLGCSHHKHALCKT